MRLLRFLNTVLFRALMCSFLLLAMFIWLAQLIGRQQVANFDQAIIEAVRGLSSSAMTAWMKAFTATGSGIYISVITLVLLMILGYLGYRRELFFFVGVIVGSSLLNVLLKEVFQRARPDVHRIIKAGGYSFPSGHSMAAFTLYGVTIYLLWKHLRSSWLRSLVVTLGILLVLVIGTSRVYLGVHYPSDVIGGYMMSAAWLITSIGFYNAYLHKRRLRE